MTETKFSPYVAVVAEGRRIGIMSCLTCGAAILLGTTDEDFGAIHSAWHAAQVSS
ncbi:hypothetical protein [Rhodococcus erythropolis]|uniref:hypothetical protein n=1 Tax=Rhodococcus erythropolis TaxID=1833 RepID=UPI001BE7075C|nr:hypothetical protein [Rhodococcus erythropolis]MBT2266415.1 hypothetical protein [Rhodococcus erythropolis]